MWLFWTDDPKFGGKKLWLRPGKKFILGRTKSDLPPEGYIFEHKTVSKKHLTVDVGRVDPGSYPDPYAKSQLTLEDLNSKLGTRVDGEKLTGKVLVDQNKEQIKVILGKFEWPLFFKWVPVNITCAIPNKEVKAGALNALYEKFGPLDIKILNNLYVTGVTTHVAQNKRNTAKGLQALIDGKYIVDSDTWFKAITDVTTSPEDGKALLEENWVFNFPDAAEYLPAKGNEPTQRDSGAYAPDTRRQNMFEGYTFIFYDKKQHDNLFPAISQGSGKALFHEVIIDKTEVVDFVKYVKDIAGETGFGSFEDGCAGKGVVVVKHNPITGAGTEFFAGFNKTLAMKLDHRLIEQNEFLDAILGVDASVLRKPLEFAPTGQTAMSFKSSAPAMTPAAKIMPIPATVGTGRFRRPVTVKPKFFDDEDEEEEQPPAVVPNATAQTAVVESQSQGLFVSQDSEMDVDQEPLPPKPSRKRNTPPIDYDMDDMDNLLPTAAKRKKQRLAEEAARRERGESIPAPPQPAPLAITKSMPKAAPPKVREEVDILEEARKNRERLDEKARAERDELTQRLDDVSMAEVRKNLVIETMTIRPRVAPQRTSRADESTEWDEAWNGRKNFKKFRRRGAAVTDPDQRRRNIVPMEPVKMKDYGLGDERWADIARKKKSQSQGHNQGGKQTKAQQREDETKAQEAEEHRLAQAELNAGLENNHVEGKEDSSSEEIETFAFNKPSSKAAPAPGKLAEKTTNSQTGKKRRAATTLTNAAPAKKAKKIIVEDSDSDSDDGIRFKFKPITKR